MSVRFVVGRAGSGKTWRCLEAIRARLRESAAEGSRLLLIVPEQASFQMERALIETRDIPGYARCEVLSFQRLAFRIFSETGAGPRRSDQTIGASGRLMVMRRLLRQERGALRLLGRVADRPGLTKQLAATVDELIREKVSPEDLVGLAGRAERSDPLQAARFADVARLYRAYLDYLIDGRVDPAQYLSLAADRVERCAWLEGAEVWVDGFAGLTAHEYALLTKLASRVASMEITLLVDPGASAVTGSVLPKDSLSLFGRTERTLVRLRESLRNAGIAEQEPVRLSGPRPPRFVKAELADLERCVFRDGPRESHSALSDPSLALGAGRDRDSMEIGAASTSAVTVVEVGDRRSEVDAAVAEIQRLTRKGMRYRDIAVVVRDLAAYHDLLMAAMRSHGIPCFIDRRQPTTHHPLIQLVRGLLSIAVDDCRLESVRLTLKTDLLPVTVSEADRLENYLVAHGLEGSEGYRSDWQYRRVFESVRDQNELTAQQKVMLARVNAVRRKWYEAVEPWLKLRERGALTGEVWADALLGVLERNGTAERLAAWALSAEEDGRSNEADMHRQAWSDFVGLLNEVKGALGTEEMRAEECREILEAGLSEFNLGLAPPTLDQVLVGAIERSRHPAMRAVLILGFDEHHFPMQRSEDPLLGDGEREAMEAAGVPTGPSRRRQILDEQMLAYIALTRASERLWVSYPRASEDGKALQPSPYLEDVLAAVPGLAVEKIGNPRIEGQPLWVTRVGELGARLAGEFRRRGALARETAADLAEEPEQPARSPAATTDEVTAREIWNGLYAAAREREEWRSTLSRCLGGLAWRNVARLDPELMAEVVKKPFRASVSRLERFAACPFAHFAEYTLELAERVEAELTSLSMGTICHAVLEKLVGDLARNKERLADLGDDEIAVRVDKAAAEAVPEIADEILLSVSRNAFQVDRSRGHLGRVTRWQRDAARAGGYRPVGVEFPFGFDDSKGGLTLITPKKREVRLRGRIDRVDVAELGGQLIGMVIDYKRSKLRQLSLAEVYHGLALQLVGYLLAIEQTGESLAGRRIKPVAAFYLPLLEAYQTVGHPDEGKAKSYQYRGIADAGAVEAMELAAGPGWSSQYYSARLKKDGEPYANCDLTAGGQLRGVMRHVGLRMGQLADAIIDGDVNIAPYRLGLKMPCGFCAYMAICRYEIETQPPRTLEGLDRADALARMCGEGPDV